MQVVSIFKISVRELFHEKVLYLLLAFAASALGLAVMLGQMTYTGQTKLTIDFMFAAMEISMVLFSIFMGMVVFQRELLTGSVAMVLSKPIPRVYFILGKFAGQTFVQFVIIMAMTMIIWGACLMDSQVDIVPFLQAGYMIFLEVSVVTAVAYFLSVMVNPLLTTVGTLLLFCLGHLRPFLETTLKYKTTDSIGYYLAKTIVPNLEVFNMKALVSYGNALSVPELMWASVYGVFTVAAFFLAGVVIFGQKDIVT